MGAWPLISTSVVVPWNCISWNTIIECLFKEAKAPDSLDDKEHGKNYGSSWVEFPENAALSVKVKVAPGPEGSELIDNQED